MQKPEICYYRGLGFSSVPLCTGSAMCSIGSLALQNARMAGLIAVCRMTETLQLCVPSGQYHLLINPLVCEILSYSEVELELFGHGYFPSWFPSDLKCDNYYYLLFES